MLILVKPDGGGVSTEAIRLGFFFGSMFSQTTLAAAWAAFGPGALAWRIPLSLIWVSILVIAIAFNIGVNGGPPLDFAALLGGCLFGQWFLLQFPFWGLVLRLGLRLQHMDDSPQDIKLRELQFGIRQLIIITAIVGVVLGIGRFAVTTWGGRFGSNGAEPIVLFGFLAVASIVQSVPLLLATLMRRMVIPGVLVALALIVAVTVCEVPLLASIVGGSGAQTTHFIAINGLAAAAILSVVLVVRLNGYYLARHRTGTTEVKP